MKPKRITVTDSLNDFTQLSADEAKKLLRRKYIPGDEYAPALELWLALEAAYPEAQLPDHESGKPRGYNWKRLAWLLACDFVPAFKGCGTLGRKPVNKRGLVAKVDELMESGQARSAKHACEMVQRRGLFPTLTNVYEAYKKDRRKLEGRAKISGR